MKKQWSIKSLINPVFIFVVGFGLLAGCGNNRNSETFEATLNGSNEVPEVNTDASGTVTVTLEGDSIHVEGQFSGLSSEYIASHIHKGGENENGAPILPLEPTLGSDKLSGSWDASYQLNESQVSALKADSLYINVHSTEHKPGEIRGQLTSSDSGM